MFEGPRAAGVVARVHETAEGHDDHVAVHAGRWYCFQLCLFVGVCDVCLFVCLSTP